MWGGAGGSECARDPEASDLGLELIGLGSQERPALGSIIWNFQMLVAWRMGVSSPSAGLFWSPKFFDIFGESL